MYLVCILKNYKIFMKEIKGQNKWRDIVCSLIERFDIVVSPNCPIGLVQFQSKSQKIIL